MNRYHEAFRTLFGASDGLDLQILFMTPCHDLTPGKAD